ncbi:GreA/GreB family elongation factor [Kineobactrum salinum]|uniref:GreA/GreB family elongation factor n=1 Tax=Kineobactrum salinum TaxID=2708301 RepID=A0A6C0U384_9GAMM|nr:GreA/GreB family elongation factor [Kineobactrum salinum]QIB66551.1 GreA/GreB family elongation factor [Kineobactrum salinum]
MTASSLSRLRNMCSSLRIYSQPFQLARVFDQLEILKHGEGVPGGAQAVARLGGTVRVEDLSYQGDAQFSLVPAEKADPDRGLISIFSPLGAALLGAKVGDIVHADLLGREYRFLLVDILYNEGTVSGVNGEGLTS